MRSPAGPGRLTDAAIENIILDMENNVLIDPTAIRRSVERALAPRYAAYTDEVRRLMEATSAIMQRTGGVDPRVGEIVAEAGLSNQAFYRHFRSKDELLLAILDDGIRRLVDYLAHRMAGASTPEEKIRSWIEGIVAQAVDATAAHATRPFVIDRGRLAECFPDEVARSVELLSEPLRALLREETAAFPDADPERDAAALYDLAMGWMERAIALGARPTREDAEHLVAFAMRGISRAHPSPGPTG